MSNDESRRVRVEVHVWPPTRDLVTSTAAPTEISVADSMVSSELRAIVDKIATVLDIDCKYVLRTDRPPKR